jgi:hypothetical protein
MKIFCISSIVFLLTLSVINGQSSSVYTRYGVGDLEYGYSAKMIGIGDLGVTQLDADHLVITNPASWSAITRTRIEFGVGYRGVQISDKNQTNYTSETEFKGFTFGFPVSREYGIGVVAGLVPYSRISYNAEKYYPSTDQVVPSYKLHYQGSGGLSKIFIGSSFFLPLGFSAGVTLDYYFGNQNYVSKIEFDEAKYISTTYENERRSTGVGTTVGLISSNLAREFRISGLTDLRIGIAYNYIANLSTDTLFTQTSLSLVDIVAFAPTETKIPGRLDAGVSFELAESYNVSFDYLYQPMSQYTFNYLEDSNLRNASKYSAAFEFKPKKTLGMTNFDQIIWRIGLSYEQSQYKFNGQGINQYSTFGGFSYPLGVDNTIDFAVQYANRGTTENNLLNENSISVYLGLSFGELWFLRFDK